MARKNNKRKFKERFYSHGKANSGHPTYVFAKQGDEFWFVGITHSNITDNMSNIPLDVNPNPSDKRPAFIRPRVGRDHYKSFGRNQKTWKFADSDKGKVKKVIKGHKKKEMTGFEPNFNHLHSTTYSRSERNHFL